MNIFDETVVIQGDVDALAMVLEEHRRDRKESKMMCTPPPIDNDYDDDDDDDDDEQLYTHDFKHTFDDENFELNLETTEV